MLSNLSLMKYVNGKMKRQERNRNQVKGEWIHYFIAMYKLIKDFLHKFWFVSQDMRSTISRTLAS